MTFASCFLAIIVGTWNGNWFPSGRAEHRAHPEVEAATIAAAGKMLRAGIDSLDPEGKEDIVLALCEIRHGDIASRLAEAIGLENLQVAAVSGYRRRDRYDQQQNVIMTTLPIADAGWAKWTPNKEATAPRGYAYANLILEPAVTAAVYCVHLKSNYGTTSEEIAAANRAKRESAIDEFIRLTEKRDLAILAGDFNSDRWREEYAEEKIFSMLSAANFVNLLALLPPNERGTHPNARYGDSCLDYIMTKGFDNSGLPKLRESEHLSDHQAVFARVVPKKLKRSSSPRSRRSSRRQEPSDMSEAPARTL